MKLLPVFALLLWFQTITQPILCQTAREPKNVAIFIFNDVQIIDYTGPYEVFVNASSGNFSQFNVFTVAETPDAIKTVGDMTVLPAYSFSNHPKPDVLVIPGGWGSIPHMEKACGSPIDQRPGSHFRNSFIRLQWRDPAGNCGFA